MTKSLSPCSGPLMKRHSSERFPPQKRARQELQELVWLPDEILWCLGQALLNNGPIDSRDLLPPNRKSLGNKSLCETFGSLTRSKTNRKCGISSCYPVLHGHPQLFPCPVTANCSEFGFAKIDSNYREKETRYHCRMSADAVGQVSGLLSFLWFSSTSKRCRHLLLKKISSADFSFRSCSSHQVLDFLLKFEGLKNLKLVADPKHLSRCPNGEVGNRSTCCLTKTLISLEMLRSLTLNVPWFESAGRRRFELFGDLEFIRSPPPSAPPFSSLKNLRLCGHLNLVTLNNLEHLKNLNSLALDPGSVACNYQGCNYQGFEKQRDRSITDTGQVAVRKAISGLVGLTDLSLRGCFGRLTVTGWDVKKLTNLKRLEISHQKSCRGVSGGNPYPCQFLHDDFLGTVTSLERLDLTKNKLITGVHFSNLTGLRRLDARSSVVKPLNVAALRMLERLTMHAPVSPSSFSKLSYLLEPRKNLDLSHEPLTRLKILHSACWDLPSLHFPCPFPTNNVTFLDYHVKVNQLVGCATNTSSKYFSLLLPRMPFLKIFRLTVLFANRPGRGRFDGLLMKRSKAFVGVLQSDLMIQFPNCSFVVDWKFT